jgi:DNA-binding transcriptional MerR regulator
MELIPIGDAARKLGLAPSALRYYDDRGLVPSRERRSGKRWYGRQELRRLAFIKITQRLGLPLHTVAAILDSPTPRWRQVVRQQITDLEQLIEQAQAARVFLTHALNCPSPHPVRDCPRMGAALDGLLEGGALDELADEHYYRPRRETRKHVASQQVSRP